MKQMAVQRGNRLDYLGMKIRRKGKIIMYEHIKKFLKELSDPLRNKSLSSFNTPKLFEVRKDTIPLDKGRSKLFTYW